MIAPCTPTEARRMLQDRAPCQLLDVREFAEYAQGHAPGARLIPLGEISKRCGELDKSRPIIVLCKGGTRAAQAAQTLSDAGCGEVIPVEGGTDAWIAAGLPIERENKAPWSLERQVRLTAGALVLIGLLIPPWPWLSALVGAGLMFAAISNTCGMGMALSKMPWNRPRAGSACSETTGGCRT